MPNTKYIATVKGKDGQVYNYMDSEAREQLSAMVAAASGDVGKALAPKTISDGKVIEWQFVYVSSDPTVIASAVEDWLAEHPEATTTVQDGSVTKAKLDSELNTAIVPLVGVSPTYTEVSGKYITNGGAEYSNASFARSGPIAISKGDVVSLTAVGYSTQVAMIVLTNEAGTSYTPVVISEDSGEHTFTYTAEHDGYYLVSYKTNNATHTLVQYTKNTIIKIVDNIDALKSAATLLTGFDPEYTEIAGKYLNQLGVEYSNNQFAMSAPIAMSKGDIIELTATGYQTQVGMITLSNQAGTSYTPAVASIDSSEHTYTYIAQNDGYYVVSYKTNNATHSLVQYSKDSNRAIIKRIESLEGMDLQGLINDAGYQIVSDNVSATMSDEGHYIEYNGVYQTSSNFNLSTSISLPANSTIVFNARGYLATVALLAKVDNNVYTPLVVSYDSDEHKFVFSTTEAMNVVISTNKNVSPVYSIYTSRIDTLDKRVKEIEKINVDGLFDETKFKTLSDKITATMSDDGHYIQSNGAYQSSGNFALSSSITVPANSTIVFNSKGYLTSVAVLAQVKNSSYIPLIVSEDSNEHKFIYTTFEEISVVISSNKTVAPVYSIYTSRVDSIDGRLATIEDKVNNDSPLKYFGCTVLSDGVAATMSDSGHYIQYDGTYQSSSGYSISTSISLPKNSTISFNAKGYQTNVAVLAQVKNGAYTPLVISPDSNEHTFTYTTYDAINVVISSNNAVSPVYDIFTSRVDDVEGKVYDLDMDLFAFATMGVIGDSLASGASNYTGGTEDRPNYSWGKCIQRVYGTQATLFTKGGLTTKTWLTDSNGLTALQSADAMDCYVIGLGVNDAYSLGDDYLGTASDVHVGSEDQNADSYYGNYSKIIAAIKTKSPRAKIFCLTNAVPSSQTKLNYNIAVKAIADLYTNTYAVDLASDSFYTSDIFTRTWNGAHSTAVGYKLIAKNIHDNICRVIRQNISDFLDIQWIIENHP